MASSWSSPITALTLGVARMTHRFHTNGTRTLTKTVVVCGFLVSWKAAGALGVPLILYGAYRLAREVRWAKVRAKVLAEAGLPAPSLLGSMKAHRLEWKRARRVRTQWEVACSTAKLTAGVGVGKVPPTLLRLRSNSDMDMLARIKPGEMGIPVERIMKNAKLIAETIGCRELVVTLTTIGCADLTFMWTEAIQRTLPVAEVPRAPKGTLAYGIHRDGAPATVSVGLPLLISGMTGSGKSGCVWSLLGNLNLQGIHYWLYASDKGGLEFGVLHDKVGKTMGPLTVKWHATNVNETADMITELELVMKDRQRKQAFRKWTVDNAKEFPLIVLAIDESVEILKNLKPEHQTKLLTIISQLRASGGMPIACTQMAQKDVMGAIRDMFPQRLSLAQPNRVGTDMALGEGAESLGAWCSEIKLPEGAGTGFAYDERRRGFELFRAGWCDDEDIKRIASGLPPVGAGRNATKVPVPVAVYRVYDTPGRLLYVGISDKPGRRLNDEHSNPADPDYKTWWPQVDPKRTLVIYKRDLETARMAEAEAIRDELPLYNDQHNRLNPTRVDWRAGEAAPEVTLPTKEPRFTFWRSKPAAAEPEDVSEPDGIVDPDLVSLVALFPAYEPPVEVPAVEEPSTPPEEVSVPNVPAETPATPPAERPLPGGRYSVRRQASPETLERARLRREARKAAADTQATG